MSMQPGADGRHCTHATTSHNEHESVPGSLVLEETAWHHSLCQPGAPNLGRGESQQALQRGGAPTWLYVLRERCCNGGFSHTTHACGRWSTDGVRAGTGTVR